MENDLFRIIFNVTTRLKIPAIVIGGLALPAYNVARLTLDIDICICVTSQDVLNQFVNALKENDISTLQNPKIDQDLFSVFGKNSEAEIWLKPCDAFSWDDQMVKRMQVYTINVHVLAIEDFILTKLARADRSSTDIDDIIQLLIANKDNIDQEYLHYRLRWVDLLSDFSEILNKSKIDFENFN